MTRRAFRPRFLLALIALPPLASPGPVSAQTGLAPEVTRAADAAFDDIDPQGPGCAMGIVADQMLVYGRGYGLANLDYGLPVTTRSNFYLGSVGKQFTAAALVLAARAGYLSLDDPVQKWIPEIPEYDRPITIRHLVHHTSGLRDYLELWNLAGIRAEDVHTDEEVISILARQKAPNFPAGDEYLYSNSGYFLLSQIVARATAKSLREFAEAEVLGPLGMDRTYIHDDRTEVMDQRVVGYEAAGNGYRMANPWNFEQVGSGGVFSNIEDLVNWDRNYYTEEVGGPGFTDQLLQRGVLTDGQVLPYAFGLTHGRYRGLATIGHGGALAGFRSELLRFPEQRTTVLVLCNFPTSDPASRARRVADAVLADKLGPAPEPQVEEAGTEEQTQADLTQEQLDAFVGHWRASMGIEVEIRREGEGLIFIQDGGRTPIVILGEARLRLEAANVDMTTSRMSEGKYTFMEVVQNGTAFTAERFEPEVEGPDNSELVGEYYSEELDATYRIYESDLGLMMEIPPGRNARVYLGADDQVQTPLGTLSLQREGDAVTGFTVDAGRVRGVVFRRVGSS